MTTALDARPLPTMFHGCTVTPKIAEILSAHLREPQPLPHSMTALRSVRALLDRGWLHYVPSDHSRTEISAAGRHAAEKLGIQAIKAIAS